MGLYLNGDDGKLHGSTSAHNLKAFHLAPRATRLLTPDTQLSSKFDEGYNLSEIETSTVVDV